MQQINLYEAPPETNFFKDYAPFPQAAVGMLLLLVGIYSFESWGQRDLVRQVAFLDSQYQRIQQEVADLKNRLPDMTPDSVLEETVNRLQARQMAMQEMVRAVNVENIGNTVGFSRYLEGLARHRVQGLWLTRIEFDQGGKQVVLKGLVGRAEYVPRLLQQLTHESVFEGTRFNLLDLNKDKSSTSELLRFELSTQQVAP